MMTFVAFLLQSWPQAACVASTQGMTCRQQQCAACSAALGQHASVVFRNSPCCRTIRLAQLHLSYTYLCCRCTTWTRSLGRCLVLLPAMWVIWTMPSSLLTDKQSRRQCQTFCETSLGTVMTGLGGLCWSWLAGSSPFGALAHLLSRGSTSRSGSLYSH